MNLISEKNMGKSATSMSHHKGGKGTLRSTRPIGNSEKTF